MYVHIVITSCVSITVDNRCQNDSDVIGLPSRVRPGECLRALLCKRREIVLVERQSVCFFC